MPIKQITKAIVRIDYARAAAAFRLWLPECNRLYALRAAASLDRPEPIVKLALARHGRKKRKSIKTASFRTAELDQQKGDKIQGVKRVHSEIKGEPISKVEHAHAFRQSSAGNWCQANGVEKWSASKIIGFRKLESTPNLTRRMNLTA